MHRKGLDRKIKSKIDHSKCSIPKATIELSQSPRTLVKEEGRDTRNGYEASKGVKGISGL